MYPDALSSYNGTNLYLPRTNSFQTSMAPMSSGSQRIDIVFAYANAFGSIGKNKEFRAMSDREIINPDEMFNKIVQVVQESNKKLTIAKKILNYNSFDKILDSNPRVLILMCHGQLVTKKKGQEHCYFCFEDEQ